MDSLKDIASIPDTISSLYEKVKSDLISHIFLYVVLLYLGFDVSGFYFFTFDAAKIVEDPSLKLLKETGLIFLVPVIPVLMLIVYIGLLRALGGFIVNISGIIWAPSKYKTEPPNNAIVNRALTYTAFTMKKREVRLEEVFNQIGLLFQRYQFKYSDEFNNFQKSMPTRNASIYLQNASVFLVAWIVAFAFCSESCLENFHISDQFWKGFCILSVYWLFCMIRLRRFMIFSSILAFQFVNNMLFRDEDYREQVDMCRQKGKHVFYKIKEEREKNIEKIRGLVELILDKLSHKADVKEKRRKAKRGWPMPGIYTKGYDFYYNKDEKERGDGLEWIIGYLCHAYWVFYVRIIDGLGKRFRRLVIFIFGPLPPSK